MSYRSRKQRALLWRLAFTAVTAAASYALLDARAADYTCPSGATVQIIKGPGGQTITTESAAARHRK